MLVKILGGMDLAAALVLFFISIRIPLSGEWFVLFGILIMMKSFLGMFKEIGSWIDISSGFFIILGVLFPVPMLILFLFAFLMFQKGIVSFL